MRVQHSLIGGLLAPPAYAPGARASDDGARAAWTARRAPNGWESRLTAAVAADIRFACLPPPELIGGSFFTTRALSLYSPIESIEHRINNSKSIFPPSFSLRTGVWTEAAGDTSSNGTTTSRSASMEDDQPSDLWIVAGQGDAHRVFFSQDEPCAANTAWYLNEDFFHNTFILQRRLRFPFGILF